MRLAVAILPAVLVAATLSPSSAAPPEAGVTSPNVSYLGTLPLDAGSATGARLVGKYLYVAGLKTLSIWDVSEPTLPKPMSVTPVGLNFPSEDVDTNGSVLLLNDEQLASGALQVWDVRNKALPVRYATLPNMRDHTFSCVLDCKWAYGSRGSIVDLRDPTRPKLAGSWGNLARGTDGFDVTEVAPGLVLTSSRTMRLLDARRNPASPNAIRTGTTRDRRLIHSNRWPRGGRDKFFLVQGETPFSQTCDGDSGAIMTWDARTFSLVDEFRVANGNGVDGSPPANAAGCTAMWFQHHPSFKDGGLVAAAFFEHGVRFLDVDKRGQVSEVGYYMPAGGSTIASYWVTPEIVYAIDLARGIDILRFDRSGRKAAAPPAPPRPARTKLDFTVSRQRSALWCQPSA